MITLKAQRKEINKRLFSVTYIIVDEKDKQETKISVSEWQGERQEQTSYDKLLTDEEIDRKINKMADSLMNPRISARSWFRR